MAELYRAIVEALSIRPTIVEVDRGRTIALPSKSWNHFVQSDAETRLLIHLAGGLRWSSPDTRFGRPTMSNAFSAGCDDVALAIEGPPVALSSLGDDSSAALGLDEQLNTERAIGPTNDGSVWIEPQTRNGRHIKGHYRAGK